MVKKTRKKKPPLVERKIPKVARMSEDVVDIDGMEAIPGSERREETDLGELFSDLLDGWEPGMPWNTCVVKDGFTFPLKIRYASRRYDCGVYASCLPEKTDEALDRIHDVVQRRVAVQFQKVAGKRPE